MAIILEPVQGEGGFNVVPGPYLSGLRKICDKYGILLILDEVQSGFGRTGKWAAYQHFDVTPDLSTWLQSMGSGMPIGAVIGRADIMDACCAFHHRRYLSRQPGLLCSSHRHHRLHGEDQHQWTGEKVGKIVRDRFSP